MRKNKKKSLTYNSILKIHDEKMLEFSDANKKKRLGEIKVVMSKNIKEVEVLQKDYAMGRVNNNNIVMKDDISMKISDMLLENVRLEGEIIEINSEDKRMEYVLNTCGYLNEYLRLEESEKALMLNDEEDVERELYEINHKKNDVMEEYMKVIDSTYSSKRSQHLNMSQIYCDNCNIKYEITSGMAVCYECGKCIYAIHQSEELSYKEQQEMDYRPQFTYEKSTHLDDWLRRFQAKEHKEIPQAILDKVVLEAHKHHIKDLNTLTELQVKKFLKTLDLNDYYDNVISIINRINRRPPFLLTSEIEQKVKDMFQQIQVPFEKFKDPTRKNMLSYSYLLNKFFLILDLPEFSRYFFLLKSPEKLRQQDHTFKKIVDELAKTDKKNNWKFFPSL